MSANGQTHAQTSTRMYPEGARAAAPFAAGQSQPKTARAPRTPTLRRGFRARLPGPTA